MNVAIIDDEVHCIESLVIHLRELFPELTLIYKSSNALEAVEKLPQLPLDLVFMDVEMPGLNGFQLLEKIPDHEFDVIFTTAYSEYALQAFKVKAISYLMKPIDEDELKEVIGNWMKSREGKSEQNEDITELLEHLKKTGIMKSKISVPVSDGYEFIEVDKIMYCQGQSNYTNIFLADKSKVLISKTLKEVETTLKPFLFLRVHRSYLLNPNYMKKFSRNDGGYIIMEDEQIIPISRAKRSLIVNLFDALGGYPS
ncbi:MAG: LytTR family DNA-binding domain-containing protein [Weeksellaceae bacterium]